MVYVVVERWWCNINVLERKDDLVLFNKRLTSPTVVKAQFGVEWEQYVVQHDFYYYSHGTFLREL